MCSSNFAVNRVMSEKSVRGLLLFWPYFIGLGALCGAAMFVIDPTGARWGMEPILPLLREWLPALGGLFNDFYASAVALLLVVALPNAVAAVLAHKRSGHAPQASLVSGVLLMGWTVLEIQVWGAAMLTIAYLIFGAAQINTAIYVKAKRKIK